MATHVQRALFHMYPTKAGGWGLPDGRKVDGRSFGIISSFTHVTIQDPVLCQVLEIQSGRKPDTPHPVQQTGVTLI